MERKMKKKSKDLSDFDGDDGPSCSSGRKVATPKKRKVASFRNIKQKKKLLTDLKNTMKSILPSFFANNKELGKCMFHLVCDILSITKINDDVGDMRFLTYSMTKEKIFNAVYKLLSVHRPKSEDNDDSTLQRPYEQYKSMYRENFQQGECIGSGGYGYVYKARHKLDEVSYAVKKIPIQASKTKKIRRSLEEVKTLAKLNHPNVVNYKHAWIEPSIAGQDDQLQPPQSSQSGSEESVSTVAKINDVLCDVNLCSNKRSRSYYENTIVESSEDSSENHSHQIIILYIQMSLCEKNLREWMDSREEESSISDVEKIAKQILCGLNYIHNLNVIHHDINPKNIFISTGPDKGIQVQLGDFGLACLCQKEAHSQDFGTPLYVAPEQLNKKCEPKSDIYSFGIVLFELMFPMQSDHERDCEVRNLKKQVAPDNLKNKYPLLMQIAMRSVNEDLQMRPSAEKILEILGNNSDFRLTQMQNEIDNLKYQNDELTMKMNEMKRKM